MSEATGGEKSRTGDATSTPTRRRCFGALAAALLCLLAVMVVRAASMTSTQIDVAPLAPVDVDEALVLGRLREGVRIRTISHQGGEGRDESAFRALHALLRSAYPKLHAKLELEQVSEQSLLFRWQGRDPSLPALVLLAHQDVVPIDPGTQGDWTRPPFAAELADGYLWGRGTLDDKLALFSIAHAVEGLVGDGFEPRRDVYLAFGHDEELGGSEGAVEIAGALAERHVPVGLVLDEGGAVVDGLVPGIDGPVAVVGVAEKGYLSLVLTARGSGGHSSAPPPESVIGILARAIRRLERDGFPARLDGAARAFFVRGIGPESAFVYRLVYANLWLTSPLVEAVMSSIPGASTMLRTTTAPTIFHSGQKDNVLPARAEAVVNFRILPGETSESVIRRVEDVVGDPRVEIEPLPKRREPTGISDMDSAAFGAVARSIREVFPGTVVAPYLMVAGTDARYFHALCDCVYRFLPVRLQMSDLTRAHGTDERVPADAVGDAVRFYRRLIENASEADL